MPDQTDGNTKNRRSEQLIQVSAKATKAFNVRNIGTVRRVLFEKFDDEKGILEGHTDNYIKVYCIADDSHQFLDNFADIYLDSLYEDGILGKIITSV
jgi:threonylcarbamoyladenosine tRNA methylthiotransferase MtaB